MSPDVYKIHPASIPVGTILDISGLTEPERKCFMHSFTAIGHAYVEREYEACVANWVARFRLDQTAGLITPAFQDFVQFLRDLPFPATHVAKTAAVLEKLWKDDMDRDVEVGEYLIVLLLAKVWKNVNDSYVGERGKLRKTVVKERKSLGYEPEGKLLKHSTVMANML